MISRGSLGYGIMSKLRGYRYLSAKKLERNGFAESNSAFVCFLHSLRQILLRSNSDCMSEGSYFVEVIRASGSRKQMKLTLQ